MNPSFCGAREYHSCGFSKIQDKITSGIVFIKAFVKWHNRKLARTAAGQ